MIVVKENKLKMIEIFIKLYQSLKINKPFQSPHKKITKKELENNFCTINKFIPIEIEML